MSDQENGNQTPESGQPPVPPTPYPADQAATTAVPEATPTAPVDQAAQPPYETAPYQPDYQQQPQQGAAYQQPYADQSQQGYGYQDPTQAQSTPPVYGNPNQQYYGQAPVAPAPASGPGSGKAIAALVCGIFAIVFSWTVLIGIVLGIVAIVLAGQYIKSFGKDGKATGGRVCGVIGIIFSVLSLLFIILSVVLFGVAVDAIDRYDSGSSSSYLYETPRSTTPTPSPDSSGPFDSAAAEAEAIEAAEAAMQSMINPSPELLAELALEYDEEFYEVTGLTMASVGLDPNEIVQATLPTITYEIDDLTSVNAAGTEASIFVTTSSESVWDYITAFMDMDEIINYTPGGDPLVLGDLFRQAMTLAEPDSNFFYLEFTRSSASGQWMLDEDSFDDAVEWVFGIY